MTEHIPQYTDKAYVAENTEFEDTRVYEPEVSVHKVEHHVKEVHPVVHKEVEQTIVHPEVKHEYEHEVLPTRVENDVIETPDANPSSPHRESTLKKVLSKLM